MGASRYMYAERREADGWKLAPPPGPREEFRSDWDATCCNNSFAVLCFDYRRYGRFQTIAPDRGLPADVSDEVRREIEDFDLWNPSWYTLRELQAVDWEQEVIMDNDKLWPKKYIELKDAGQLLETNAKMEAFIERVGREVILSSRNVPDSPFEVVPYRSTLRAQCPNLMHDLEDLPKLGEPDDVRIIVAWN